MAATKPETGPRGLRSPAELLQSSAFLLKRLGFFAKERATDAYEPAGLGPYHHAVLIALEEATHETQGAIADILGYDRGQLVGLLDELEEHGLVERHRDREDRRRHIVSLTTEGRRALARLRKLATALEDDLLAPLSGREREQLHSHLHKLAEHHLQH